MLTYAGTATKGFFDSRSRCSPSLRMADQEKSALDGRCKHLPRPSRTDLLDHAALGIFDEFHQLKHVFAEVAFGFDLLQRLRSVEAGVEQSLECFLDLHDAFLAEATALKSDGVGT